MLDPLVLLILAATGLVAGFVDAIAGGGGMVSVPVLLSVGIPPIGAIATNKAQSTIGTAIAARTYWKKGLVELRPLLPAAIASFAGSLAGAFTVEHVDTSSLTVGVPVALIAIAAYFLFAPKLTDADRHARLDYARFVPVMAAFAGFYDGLFGPGVGSFLTMGFVMLFGLGVTRAAAHTKALNLMSNAAALLLFLFSGHILWAAAGAMVVGQVAGGYLGALTGIRFGARLIRPLVVIVSMILALRLLITGHS